MDYGEYVSDTMQAIAKIDRSKIDKAVDILFKAWKKGATVYTCGNGGSASTASHMVCDLAKCTIVDGKKRLRVIGLVDNIPWVSALTNDNGWDNVYYEQLLNYFTAGDVLIGLSVHGGKGRDQAGAWTQNVLKAIDYVNQTGGFSIGLTGFDGGEMEKICTVNINVPVDSTPIVESLHCWVEHYMANKLKDKIEKKR